VFVDELDLATLGFAGPAATGRPGEIPRETDCLLEEAGFELVVPDFRETFLLYRFRAANWPGATAGFDDR